MGTGNRHRQSAPEIGARNRRQKSAPVIGRACLVLGGDSVGRKREVLGQHVGSGPVVPPGIWTAVASVSRCGPEQDGAGPTGASTRIREILGRVSGKRLPYLDLMARPGTLFVDPYRSGLCSWTTRALPGGPDPASETITPDSPFRPSRLPVLPPLGPVVRAARSGADWATRATPATDAPPTFPDHVDET